MRIKKYILGNTRKDVAFLLKSECIERPPLFPLAVNSTHVIQARKQAVTASCLVAITGFDHCIHPITWLMKHPSFVCKHCIWRAQSTNIYTNNGTRSSFGIVQLEEKVPD